MRTTERGSPLASESSSTCGWDVSAGRAPLSGSPGHRATGVSDWPYLDEHVALSVLCREQSQQLGLIPSVADARPLCVCVVLGLQC